MRKIYRKPYRIKKKKSIFKNRFFWLSILTLVIFGSIFYFLFFSEFFQVKEIKIFGNQKVLREDLENLIREKIEQKILFFPSKSIFLANFSEIKEEISKSFPQVAEINFKRKLPKTILLQIEERRPVAIFCQAENCFFVDIEGIIFESNVTKQGLVTLRGSLDREIKLGEKIIEKEQVSKILEIESKLRDNLKIQVKEVLVVSEERLNAKTLEGWEIYFNPKKDINWQLTKLKAVLEENYLPKEYIDLRFGDRAFVK